jgi:hypothetical protein
MVPLPVILPKHHFADKAKVAATKLRGVVAARAREWYNSGLMHEQSDRLSHPRAGAIGPVLMYFLLGCALVVLFCWRVATTSRQGNAPVESTQTE